MTRCSKCGHENPPDTLYCEECDWRLDVRYRAPKKRNPLAFAAVAIIVGVVSVALGFGGVAAGAVVVGAVGLVLGSYSVNLPRYLEDDRKGTCMAIAGVGMVLSVLGFIVGLASYAGVF